ncbi:hypothetical protein Nepgr_008304 [Nepenthes gracilis]|uniref:Uncharacterized protein n=1 Tax=Nepenthes gracilis TaxID=150966 RepID=A0AAD3XJ54_NEPGR|nr:hypothetical protein Nepgr_008304 [Nepenthes gracilis]
MGSAVTSSSSPVDFVFPALARWTARSTPLAQICKCNTKAALDTHRHQRKCAQVSGEEHTQRAPQRSGGAGLKTVFQQGSA